MTHLKLVTQEKENDLKEAILQSLINESITISDSDMFAYCDFYTGDFWTPSIEEKIAA